MADAERIARIKDIARQLRDGRPVDSTALNLALEEASSLHEIGRVPHIRIDFTSADWVSVQLDEADGVIYERPGPKLRNLLERCRPPKKPTGSETGSA